MGKRPDTTEGVVRKGCSMASQNVVRVVVWANHPYYRAYHTRVDICAKVPEGNFKVPLEPDCQQKILELGGSASKLAEDLAKIPGVDFLHFDHYSVGVEIGAAFEWEEVQDKVLAVLREKLFAGAEIEVS